MSFDFPASPTEGQEYTPIAGLTYVFHTPRWMTATTSYLPLSGGTLTGTLNGTTIAANLFWLLGAGAFAFADASNAGFTKIFDNSGVECLWLGNNAGQTYNLYRQNSHLFQSHAGATMTTLDGNGITVVGATAIKAGGGSWTAPSDIRLKRDIIEYKSGLAEVMALRPIEYQYNGKGGLPDDGVSYVGLDAGETEAVMPELVGSMIVILDPVKSDEPLVTEPDTEIKTIDSSALVYALVNSCKELAARVEALEDLVTGAAR